MVFWQAWDCLENKHDFPRELKLCVGFQRGCGCVFVCGFWPSPDSIGTPPTPARVTHRPPACLKTWCPVMSQPPTSLLLSARETHAHTHIRTQIHKHTRMHVRGHRCCAANLSSYRRLWNFSSTHNFLFFWRGKLQQKIAMLLQWTHSNTHGIPPCFYNTTTKWTAWISEVLSILSPGR